jgi:hypothetical protein
MWKINSKLSDGQSRGRLDGYTLDSALVSSVSFFNSFWGVQTSANNQRVVGERI